MSSKAVVDLLFVFHILFIIFGVFMGIFLSFPVVIMLILLHRMQFFIFNDCLLSKLQKRSRGLPPDTHFLQFVVLKIFNKKISEQQSKQLDYTLVLLSVTIAVFSNFLV